MKTILGGGIGTILVLAGTVCYLYFSLSYKQPSHAIGLGAVKIYTLWNPLWWVGAALIMWASIWLVRK
jgi:hypothetical protein